MQDGVLNSVLELGKRYEFLRIWKEVIRSPHIKKNEIKKKNDQSRFHFIIP